ncbi:MAG: hypothetical protein IKX71_06870 [Bacteroidales bacterium]|nr:hypothetical protein [Bacteroidales bacterium]
MQEFRKQLNLINFKEKVASNGKMRKRLIYLAGRKDGWRELCKEWKIDYDIVRGLKDMPLCELSYSSKDFGVLRRELYEHTKSRMVHAKQSNPSIVLNSPRSSIEMSIMPLTPLRIVTTLKHRYAELTIGLDYDENRICEITVKHDTNSPIYIFGECKSFICSGQNLTECYLLNIQRTEHISLELNRLKQVFVSDVNPNIKSINIGGNPINSDWLLHLFSKLPQFHRHDLFDNPPQIIIPADVPGDWDILAKRKGWKIII